MSIKDTKKPLRLKSKDEERQTNQQNTPLKLKTEESKKVISRVDQNDKNMTF